MLCASAVPTFTVTPPPEDTAVGLSGEDDIELFSHEPDLIEISDDEDEEIRLDGQHLHSTPPGTPQPVFEVNRDGTPDGYKEHDSWEIYRVGRSYELVDGSFIRVKHIREEPSSEMFLHGQHFERCRQHNGLLPKKLNELVMVAENLKILPNRVRRRRQIVLTNALFPAHRPDTNQAEFDIENYSRLVCRWTMDIYRPKSSRFLDPQAKKHSVKGTIRRLFEHEADKGFGVPEHTLRDFWRGLGSTGPPPARTGKYTFGDAFCGGGGMSMGACMAGFVNTWAFDRDHYAIETYRRRFPEADAREQSVYDFLREEKDFRVDVMHLSPPCQPHSPAHTTEGVNDEENEATGLAVSPCLGKVKPRYATLEQTFGLLQRNEWFAAVIGSFTSEGLSVKWEVLPCVEYGIPQTRRRLFILAACPGERLPEFPQRTHQLLKGADSEEGLRPGRKPALTLGEAILGLTPGIHHHPDDPLLRFADGPRSTKQTFDTPYTNTIMAGGSHNNVHPNGLRRYTIRELACIQTFPNNYQFVGPNTAIKRQIGNAVPPLMSKVLLKQVRKALEQSDLEDAKNRASPDPAIASDAVADDDEIQYVREERLSPTLLNSVDNPEIISDDEMEYPEAGDFGGCGAVPAFSRSTTPLLRSRSQTSQPFTALRSLAATPPPGSWTPSTPPLIFCRTPARVQMPPSQFSGLLRSALLARLGLPVPGGTPETAIVIEDDDSIEQEMSDLIIMED
ncbi:S-adenosyl-L-methionine-dependent methyltransferase [Sphaerosporella brunnea]|uniref:DNA (cytosine-5-)-methyltransferase n=1 Tax=Sphaerosporella brunnea TaxID=1250544 RepID=A0A5J5EV13_9PEZI|nr:S-adenosyl-L-methionine-dependent methyltransferase [Sphaerosporella brunnea]